MAYADLREFIDTLEKHGELKRVRREVDWRYELAGWIRKSYDVQPRGPALLFENVRGYPGQRVFAGGVASYRRYALALGLSPDTHLKDIIHTYSQRLSSRLKPCLVNSGSVKEQIYKGDAIKLSRLPIPWYFPLDGGRYIGTWVAILTKNRETGTRNLGTYRVQVLNDKEVLIGFLPFSHMGLHYSQAMAANAPLEVAIIIGADETVPMAASMGLPENVDEYEVSGALREAAVDLIKCETVDLEVPANAEVVLEGRIMPNRFHSEGPFGEYTGYHAGGVRTRPIVEVTCVTHRKDAILRGYLCGKPIIEGNISASIHISALGTRFFEDSGTPGVKTIYCPAEGPSTLSAIIQMKPHYVGHTRDVARAWLSSQAGSRSKYVVVVDEDIDPYDLSQVWWAIMTRTQGSRDIEVLKFGRTSRSDPSVPKNQGEYTDKVIIDASNKLDYPFVPEWNGHWAPVSMPPEEIMQLVEKKWQEEENGVSSDQTDAAGRELIDRMHERWGEWRAIHYVPKPEEVEKDRYLSYPKVTGDLGTSDSMEPTRYEEEE